LIALALHGVNKAFGDLQAVDSLELQIPSGSIFGLLGPNGAGKTTTIRMVMGIILPDSGRIEILGEPNSMKARDRIGYLPEERGLYRKMRVAETLTFFAELKGVRPRQAKKRIEEWLERFELAEYAQSKVEELSRGMQQKMQFISTMLHDPDLIILDEPFTGLDPINTRLLLDVILEQHEQGKTIVFSTHLMEQVEKLCDSICLINKGKQVLGGNLREIKAGFGQRNVVLEFDGDPSFLTPDGTVAEVTDFGNHFEIRLREGADPQELLRRALEHGRVFRFEVTEPSLNEIFIKAVEQS